MKRFAALLVSAVLFVACGDDSSSSALAPVLDEDLSSSSVESNNVSSSSAKSGGSSVKSSSSVTPKSSSSGVSQEVSSSSMESSSSSAILESDDWYGWSWNVPKESRLNPEISYDSIIDSRDNKVYKTVKIGDQLWMAENLNYYDETLDGISWCYDNDPKKCEVTGRLYTWAAAIDSVGLYDDGNGVECGYGIDCSLPDTVYGICPSGWHLPSSVEWETLIAVVGGDSTAGKMLKSQTGWVHDGNGTDDFGFSALPAGEYDPDDTYFKFTLGGYMGSFWSASEARYFGIQEDADRLSLSYSIENVYLVGWGKNRGYSVRCIKNEP